MERRVVVPAHARPHHRPPVAALASFLQQLAKSCADDGFVRLTLSSPTKTDEPVQRIVGKLIDLKGQRHLSFTLREQRRDTTQNVPFPEALAFVEQKLRRDYRAAMLATTSADWQLQLGDGDGKLIRHKPSTKAPPQRAHDANKWSLLGSAAEPWLFGLGLVGADGKARPHLAHKLQQLERYTEILSHLARDAGFDQPKDPAGPLTIVDAGCGKGHLTFAAWHLAAKVLHRNAQVLGVETRPELVEQAAKLAGEVAGTGLRFEAGDIEHVPLQQVDALIALHACNTATDHAIARGVRAGARLIVVAPCCHQQVRPQLGRPEPLAPVLAHGLFAERMAEWATDGLRTLVLEWAGYRTKAIEFVDGEHTGKNLMLAAVRTTTPPAAGAREAAKAAIGAFRTYFGINEHALDALLAGA